MFAYFKKKPYLCIRIPNKPNNPGEPAAKTSPKGIGKEI